MGRRKRLCCQFPSGRRYGRRVFRCDLQTCILLPFLAIPQVISKIMETYQPEAVVLQCGADSLSGDRLGCFNLTLKGIAIHVFYYSQVMVSVLILCVSLISRPWSLAEAAIPFVMSPGMCSFLSTSPRCWTYETSILLGETIKACAFVVF